MKRGIVFLAVIFLVGAAIYWGGPLIRGALIGKGLTMGEPFPVRTQEMIDYCESVSGVKIFREVHGVKGFADTIGKRGCDARCRTYLMVDGFEFVETRFEPSSGFRVRDYVLLEALVKETGWYRFVRREAGHAGCSLYKKYMESRHAAGVVKDPDSNYSRYCIEPIKIDGPSATIQTRSRIEEPRKIRDANRRRAKMYTRHNEIVDLSAPSGKEVLARTTSVYARLDLGGEGVPLCSSGKVIPMRDLIIQTLHP